MQEPDLLVICSVAFVAVFFVLTTLAAVMRALMLLFPQVDEPTDTVEPALVTAIVEAVKAAYPGTKVTGIEELK
jgi:hypothetical protein